MCALTTGIGFYAFVPTDFVGLSELGLISGTGMFISLFASLTVLPAALSLSPLVMRGLSGSSGLPIAIAGVPRRFRRAILASFAVLGVAALATAPAMRFDDNPLNLRDASGEAVATYRDLLADSATAPWTLDALAGDAVEAASLARRAERLVEVDGTVSIADFVPSDQARKLAAIEELELLLGLELELAGPGRELTASERREAFSVLSRHVEALLDIEPPATPTAAAGRQLSDALSALDPTSDDRLEHFEESAVGALPGQLERLTRALEAAPVTRSDLPPSLVERWVASDGRERIEIRPTENLQDVERRDRFVAAVTAVIDSATGTPLIYRESGRVVSGAFTQAFGSAAVLIAIVLAVVLRRWRDTGLVMLPLMLAALMTVAAMVLLDMSFNFANVIALPLLLGIGVDNGVHLVHRLRRGGLRAGELLGTSTARGVVVSASTTLCSFGNLAFSAHPGTASMGQVLSIGLVLTLACSLVLLPAMLGRDRP